MKTVIDVTLQSSAFILLLMVLRPWMKKAVSARFRYALWIIPALRLLIPFSLESPISLWRFGRFRQMRAALGPAAVQRTEVAAGEAVVHKVVVQPLTGSGPTAAGTLPDAAPSAVPWQASLPAILMMVWMIGILLALAWLLVSNYRFHRATQPRKRLKGFGAPLPVFLADNLPSPCLVGVLKPRILLNKVSVRSEEMMNMVLCHELTHWRRHDYLWTLLRAIVVCVWWWNPLVWAAVKLSRADCEAACDEAVTQGMNRNEREAYGMSLIELMREEKVNALRLNVGTAMKSGKKQMEERIKMISNRERKSRIIGISFALAFILVMPLIFTSLDGGAGIAEAAGAAQQINFMERFTKKGALSLSSDELSRFEGLFREFTSIRKEYGVYDSWPHTEKVKLAHSMNELRLFMNQEAKMVSALQAKGDAQATAADSLIRSFIGDAPVEVYTLMESTLGDMKYWPYTVKALRTALETQIGTNDPEETYLLPSATDVDVNTAILTAYETLTNRYAGATNELPSTTLDVSFVHKEIFGKEPVWLISFRNKDIEGLFYTALLSRSGQVIAASAPGTDMVSVDHEVMKDAQSIVPGAHDATLAQALDGGMGLLTEVAGLSETDANALTPKAQFIRSEQFNDGLEPVWIIEYYRGDQLQYKALLSYDAKPITVAKANEAFITTNRPGLYMFDYEIGFMNAYPNDKTSLFFSWSLEEKAEFSRVWRPIVEEKVKETPYFNGRGSTAYEATRNVYGLPSSQHIKQETALELAKKAIVALGASSESIDQRTVYVYFDVTDAYRPKWKFVFTNANSSSAIADGGRYKVVIDANGGEVVESFLINKSMDRVVAFY